MDRSKKPRQETMATAASARFGEAGALECENLRYEAKHRRVASRISVTRLVPAIRESFVQVSATPRSGKWSKISGKPL
jgi:hypothetical protein